MKDNIRFGPSGNCDWFYSSGNKRTLEAAKWLNDIGLTAYEYSFGKGFTLKEDTAKLIGEEFEKYGILTSVHAPYYINLANPSNEMAEKSFNYILKSLEYLHLLKGKHCVVHLASVMKLNRQEALDLTSQRLDKVIEKVYESKLNDMFICPETMGKFSQIGDYKEIIDFCQKDKILIPTFDFGHINALTAGGLKTEDDYQKIFDYCLEKLGYDKTSNCHIHFSKIEYGENGGEIKHLTFDDSVYGPEFDKLANVLVKNNFNPTIICESKGTQAKDALTMKNIFNDCKN